MLTKIINYFKENRKKIILIIIILFFIILNFTFDISEDNKNEVTSTPTPKSDSIKNKGFSIESEGKQVNRSTDTKPYLSNRFDVLQGIIGFEWQNNKILYATLNGIYELTNNTKILNEKLEEVYFSKNTSKVLYKSNGLFYLTDLNNITKTEIKITGGNIKIDNNLNYILYQNNNDLFLHDINLNTSSLLQPNLNNSSYDWLLNQNKFFIYKGDQLEIFDNQKQKISSIKISPDEKFLLINSNLENVVLASKEEGLLKIKNLKNNTTKSTAFENIEEIKIYWKNDSEILIVEKRKRGIKDLYDQYFWIVTLTGEKEYISNTQPIANKLDLNFSVTVNTNATAFIAKENNGMLWIFSLLPSVLPIYGENGISTYNLPNTNVHHED